VRVLLVWPAAGRLTSISVRYERYARGFRALGCDPVTVCLPAAAEGYDEPVAVAPDESALRDPDFYRALGADAAVVVTWLGLPDVVAALKAAGLWVVSLADSDGRVGVRAHPGATFARAVGQHPAWGTKLRAARYWATLFVGGPGEQDRPVLASAAAADRVVVCSPGAVAHLRRFFDSYRRPDLGEKVVSVPYPTDECHLTGPVPAARADRVVAIGRWEDPQKAAGVLARAAARHRAARGQTEVLVFGPNGGRWFGPGGQSDRVAYMGVRPPEEIAAALRTSRALVLPSRWESGPIVLSEALAAGCSVVGTHAVPAVVSACAEGPFGTVARTGSAAGLATAIRDEMAAWDRGERDPTAIAAHWRPRFDPAAVCRALLAGCPAGVPA